MSDRHLNDLQNALDAMKEFDDVASRAAKALNVPRQTFVDRVRKAEALGMQPGGGLTSTDSEDFASKETDEGKSATFSGTSKVWSQEIQDKKVAEIIDRAGIDLDKYRIDKIDARAWQTPMKIVSSTKDPSGVTTRSDKPIQIWNWYISVTAKWRAPKSLLDALEELHAKVTYPKIVNLPQLKTFKENDDPRLCVVAPVDAHFGKLAWAEEVGSSYDLEIAAELFDKATTSLLHDSMKYNIDRFLFLVGNDACHVDNLTNTTTRGTPQDADGRYPKIFRETLKAFCNLNDKLIRVAPVDLVLVRGNHDLLASWHLVREMMHKYASASRVKVDQEFTGRKYYPYHEVLLGLAHGDGTKLSDLPTIMATESPELCGKAKCREWLTGHRHIKGKLETKPIQSKHGFVVRTLSSLSGTDAWHYENGYVGSQACESYLYRRSSYAGHFNVEARDFLSV